MIKDSIAILCRGESLKEIELLPEVEEYVIVNGFSDEFEIEYIKNYTSSKSQIIRLMDEDDKETTREIEEILEEEICDFSKSIKIAKMTTKNMSVINTIMILRAMLKE